MRIGLFAKRVTFVIDLEGRIAHVESKVRVGAAGEDLVAALEELGVPQKQGD